MKLNSYLKTSALGLLTGIGFAFSFGCASSETIQEPPVFHAGKSEDLYEPYTPTRNTPIAVQPNAPTGNRFDWPVDEARMTRGFRTKGKRPHHGVDLAAPQGTPILASQTGTVIYTGRDFRGYGKMVMIEGTGGIATLYAHLSKIHVKQGQRIRQGQLVGSMGRTGRATGVHLHYEIRKNNGPVDPLNYLPAGSKFKKFLANK